MTRLPYHAFKEFRILGAAKSCGHGYHAGPLAGAVHEDQAIGTLSIAAFKQMFGLDAAERLS